MAWQEKLGPEPEIKWKVIQKYSAYEKGNSYYDQCLTKKVHIKKIRKRKCIN